jgi:hypothetical protein
MSAVSQVWGSRVAQMRFAYADPPYLGCCKLYNHYHGEGTDAPWDGLCWDAVSTHAALIEHLAENYDGWAYSMTSGSLRHILPAAAGIDYRIASWVKPFAAFKRNVRIAYTWEPVLFSPGRDRSCDGAPVGRDHIAESITLRRGFTGAKPDRVNRWILDILGFIDTEDTIVDLFPGAGGMSKTLGAPPLVFGEVTA